VGRSMSAGNYLAALAEKFLIVLVCPCSLFTSRLRTYFSFPQGRSGFPAALFLQFTIPESSAATAATGFG
jgi:hypothetical protein